MSWILLGVLIFVAVAIAGVSGIVMAGIGLACGWALIAHVIMGDGNIDGRKD